MEERPALFARKVRKIAAPSWPLPVGAIVVWERGACGFSKKYGHIEILTRVDKPLACSDHCQPFARRCFETFAPRGLAHAL